MTEARILGRIAKKDYDNRALTFNPQRGFLHYMTAYQRQSEHQPRTRLQRAQTEKCTSHQATLIAEAETERKKAEEEEKAPFIDNCQQSKSYIDAGNIKDAADAFASSADFIKIASNPKRWKHYCKPTTAEDIIKAAARAREGEINTGLLSEKRNMK